MEKLVQDAQELFHLNVTQKQVMSLITYEKELLEWNQKVNLTAIRDVEFNPHETFFGFIFLRTRMEGQSPASSH